MFFKSLVWFLLLDIFIFAQINQPSLYAQSSRSLLDSLFHDHGIDENLVITPDADPNTSAFEIKITILQAPTINLKSISRVDLQNTRLTAIPNPISQLKQPFEASDLLWGELSLPHILVSDQQSLIFEIDNQSDQSFVFYSQNLGFTEAIPSIMPRTKTIISANLIQSKPASYGLVAQDQSQISGQFAAIFVSEQISKTTTQANTLKACVSYLNRFHAKQNTRNLERWDWQVACTPNPKPPVASQRIPALDHASHFDQGLPPPEDTEMGMISDQGSSAHQEGNSSSTEELPFKYAPLTSNLIMLASENLQWVNLSVYPLVLKAMQQSNALDVKTPSFTTLRSNDLHEIYLGTQEGAVLRHPMTDGQVLLVALANDPIVDQTWLKSRPLLRLITSEQFNFELSMGLNPNPTTSSEVILETWDQPQVYQTIPQTKQSSVDWTLIYQGSPRKNHYLIAHTSYENPSNAPIEIEVRNLSPSTFPFEIQGHLFSVVCIDDSLLDPPPQFQQIPIKPRSTVRIRFTPKYHSILIGALSVPESQMGLSLKIE
jgi:hypothetical protein